MDDEPNMQDSIHEQKRNREENDAVARLLRPYATFLVKYPSVILCITVLIVILAAVLGIVDSAGAKDLPDFSEPAKGFEARGTELSARIRSLRNIEREISAGNLNYDITEAINKVRSRRRRNLDDMTLDQDSLKDESSNDDSFVLVYKQDNDENLLQVNHMKTICRIYDKKIKTIPNFNTYLNREPHHLPNYIALFNDKRNCNDINNDDVERFAGVLKQCVQYYKTNELRECLTLSNWQCRSRLNSTTCADTVGRHSQYLHVMLYNTFHYLADKSFLDNLDYLKLTTSITPHYNYPELFKDIYKTSLKNLKDTEINSVAIVGYKINDLKFDIFQSEIILQSLLIITAIVLVVVFIWIYSSSFFIGLMTFFTIIFALVISYLVYGRIFDMDFFPFLNMVTLIFIVGIGADDAFVYTGIWEEAKHVYVINNSENHTQYLVKWTIHSLRHAVLAMLVTSLTTAAAFFANISSSITSVKCFGLYAGTSIIVNYLLMITLFPVVIILHDKYFAGCMHSCCPGTCKDRPLLEHREPGGYESPLGKVMKFVSNITDVFFNKHLPKVLFKLRYIWIVFLSALGIGMAVVTFGQPGLSLPTSKDFQMFTSSSSLEQFDLKYKKEFFFPGNSGSTLSIYVVLGIKSVDNGYHFNPDDNGHLEYSTERIKIENEQEWLLNFCQSVKNESFYVSSTTCDFFEYFFTSLQSACSGGNTKCCNQTMPMTPAKDFLLCLYESVDRYVFTKFYTNHPVFDRLNNLRVFIIEIETNYRLSTENKYTRGMYEDLNKWLDIHSKTIREPSMRGLWWINWDGLDFYDLQISLFEGTKQSLGISIGVAFVVILITTLNILLSLYSIITIFFILSVTIGILVLAGWELNIMESIVFSVAAGLSADFTLHYSVAYRTSLLKNNQVERTKSALSHIGAAILMGAFTTFIAGLVMIPAKVLVYFQMAQFLMLVMVVSWVYGTFFFLPLCMVIGPTGHFGQLTCTKVKKAHNSLQRISTVTRRYSRDISRNKGLHVQMDNVSNNQHTETEKYNLKDVNSNSNVKT